MHTRFASGPPDSGHPSDSARPVRADRSAGPCRSGPQRLIACPRIGRFLIGIWTLASALQLDTYIASDTVGHLRIYAFHINLETLDPVRWARDTVQDLPEKIGWHRGVLDMMKSAVGVGLLLVAVSSAFAHHSAATEFDMNDPVSVEGVVSKVEWRNPHICSTSM